jgi:hypothetical protein
MHGRKDKDEGVRFGDDERTPVSKILSTFVPCFQIIRISDSTIAETTTVC